MTQGLSRGSRPSASRRLPLRILHWTPKWLKTPRALIVARLVLRCHRLLCRRHLVSNSRSLFYLVEGELHRCSVLRHRSDDPRDHPVCRLLSGRVAMVVPVHLLGLTLKQNIQQLDPLSINRGRLVLMMRHCRSMLTLVGRDQRLIRVFTFPKCRHLYRRLPRFSQHDRIHRYLRAI